MSIRPLAAPGSLLKDSSPPKRGKPIHKAREESGAYLAAIRRLPCLSCDADPAGEAAHVRMAGTDKPITGMATKPDDKWALPLCPNCHTRAPTAQHRVGEVRFWTDLGIDPLVVCKRLNSAPGLAAMRAVIFSEREKRQ